MIRLTERRGVDVRLNTEATRESLEAEGFDIVLCALGAEPKRPPIPGLDRHKNLMTAVEALENADRITGRVVVIGGGEVGVETGIFLGRRGLEVTVLGRNAQVAPEANPIHYRETFDRAWQSLDCLRVVTGAPVTGVSDAAVTYEQAGESHTLPADTLILASGMAPLTDRALAFYSDRYDFHMIGDCAELGTIMTSMRSAYAAASRL